MEMDKAIVGSCHVGSVRIGVTVPKFDEAISVLEKISIEESAYFDVAHFDRARFDEKDSSVFKAAVKAVEKL